MRVSKLEAAKTQIETAIGLYFSDGDPVSTHTLTGAANQILRDIGKARGIDSMKESFLKMTKPEKVIEMRRLLNSTQGFFKHADKNPEEVIDFNPEETYIYLFDCCLTYARLAGVETKIMKAYLVRVKLNTPDMFIWDDESRGIYDRFMENVKYKDVLKDKNLYFETMMQLL